MTNRKKLLKKIDEARRKYIRERDGKGEYTPCISCGAWTTNPDVGHYYKRGHDFTTELGGDERNVNLQCVPCNSFKNGNPQGYAAGLVHKYGEGIIKELDQKKKTNKYWKIKELEELLKYYETKKTEETI
jgi:5-methylcytosine-specific restriction endonuclease McrA